MRSPVLSSPPLKAVLYGFNERARATLQMFFDGKGRECCEVVDGGDADIGIIDLDGVDASRAWSRFREQHGRPALVLSVTERDLPDSVWVHKPLNFDTLLAGIQELRRDYVEASSSRLNPAKQSHAEQVGGVPSVPEPAAAAVDTRVPAPQSAPDMLQIASDAAVVVGNRPLVEQAILIPVVVHDKAAVVCDTAVVPQRSDADDTYYRRDMHASYGDRDDSAYRDPGQDADVTYDPENYLQGVLARAMRLAREEGVAMRLSGIGQPLVVLPDRNALVTGMRDHYLRSLCIQPMRNLRVRIESAGPLSAWSGDVPGLRRYDAVLWNVAFWTSRGRLPGGINADDAVHLLRWPNFTRLAVPPHALQIVAYWSAQPRPLRETAEALQVPVRAVYGLFSVCHALEFVTTRRVEPAASCGEPPPCAIPEPARRRLFGALLRKLGQQSS